ncbi:hypothetical protein JW710_00600, partial [Candidatus Dojkabacteria bacterium]|nr:hypothetical protein [Candidatus Dojkabacteria bacterium]
MGAGFNEIIGGSASVGPSGSGFDTDATDEERYEADLRTLCEEMYDIIDTDHLEIELRLALERSGKTYKDQSIPLDMAIRWLWMSECSSVDRALRVSNDFAASDEGRRVLGVSSTG